MLPQSAVHGRKRFSNHSHTDCTVPSSLTHHQPSQIRKRSFRLDLTLDQTSFDQYWREVAPVTPEQSPSNRLLKVLDTITGEDADADELREVMDLIQKADSIQSEDAELTTVRFLSTEKEASFTKLLLSHIDGIQEFVQQKQIKVFEPITEDSPCYYLKLKIWDYSKKRCLVYLRENVPASVIEITLKNLYESYCNFICLMSSGLISLQH